MRIAVVYQSRYGTTRRYASWIAEDLHADLLEHGEARRKTLADYDCVVYGGGLYASGISGIGLVAKHDRERLVVFTVGLADPAATDFSKILEKNLPASRGDGIKAFHFRGGIDYQRLGLIHRGMMALLKRSTDKKPQAERTRDDLVFLETYGGAVDFTNRDAITPLVEHVRRLAPR